MVVPSTDTAAPIRGCLFAASVMVPDTDIFACAEAEPTAVSINKTKSAVTERAEAAKYFINSLIVTSV
jgi:hypothetical protein